MTIRPGINAVRLAAALCAVALLAFWTTVVVWIVAAAALVGLCLAIVDAASLRKALRGLTLDRRFPPSVPRGERFAVTWQLSTESARELRGEVRDEVPPTARPRFVSWSFTKPALTPPATPGVVEARMSRSDRQLLLPERGRHTLGPAWVRLHGPCGLLDAQAPVGMTSEVRVLPETYASPERFLKDAGAEIRLLDQATLTRTHGAGTEFESLKEYRPGDDPRRIDWRATARTRRPVVRKFQVERHRDVMIAIDCGRLMGAATSKGTKLDCAVDSALMLGRIALQGGDRCGFALFDHSVRGYLPPVSGLPKLPALVDAVYDARVDWGESDFAPLFALLQRRQSKRSLIVVISDLLDVETSGQFRGALLKLAKRHVVLFAALRSPVLRDTLREPMETLEDAARHAVSFRLLHERDQAIQSLRHAGIHVVDVEPKQLTAPLINEFIRIRRRNLL